MAFRLAVPRWLFRTAANPSRRRSTPGSVLIPRTARHRRGVGLCHRKLDVDSTRFRLPDVGSNQAKLMLNDATLSSALNRKWTAGNSRGT
jgi:hypothetical protein